MTPFDYLLEDRPETGAFTLHRDAYRSPEVWDAEMRYIFERGWVFLALESQLPKPHDFLTTWLGRFPVIVSRDASGAVRAFYNSCRHKGALVCHRRRGNARRHVCAYHSWTYDSAGRNIGIKGRSEGAYGPDFVDADHDLVPVARVASYRGFVFGSAEAEGPDLPAHLGEATRLIDLLVDQSPNGIEVVPGEMRYTYDGNWKLQLENCVDGYHFTSTHPSYLKLLERRSARGGQAVKTVYDAFKGWESDAAGGTFGMREGHAMLWTAQPPTDAHPLFAQAAELAAREGETKAKWMFYIRNLSLFPNLQIAENAAMQLRIMRPLGPDQTEMVTYCLGNAGEDPAVRTKRIRQYEDFFNPTGLATPDDTVTYEDCQTGFRAAPIAASQGYARGRAVAVPGPNAAASELGIDPASSAAGGFELHDETLLRSTYRRWHRALQEGWRAAEGKRRAA